MGGYGNPTDEHWAGAAGSSTGAALDDSATSGDAPQWMHIDGVPKSKVSVLERREPHPNAPSSGRNPFGTQRDLPVWLQQQPVPPPQPPQQHQRAQPSSVALARRGSTMPPRSMDVGALPQARLRDYAQRMGQQDASAVVGGHRPLHRVHRVYNNNDELSTQNNSNNNSLSSQQGRLLPIDEREPSYPMQLRGCRSGQRRVPTPVVEEESTKKLLWQYSPCPVTHRGPGPARTFATPSSQYPHTHR